jgi:hypothetical protein
MNNFDVQSYLKYKSIKAASPPAATPLAIRPFFAADRGKRVLPKLNRF